MNLFFLKISFFQKNHIFSFYSSSLIITNQNPKELVSDKIDRMLLASGWVVQLKKQINLSLGVGVAVREFQTNIGPADYILFVNKKPVDVIEAKREDEGVQKMHLPLFSVKKQQILQEIESPLSVCDKIEEAITKSLKQAEALRQSILKKAFEGKLI